MNETIQKINTIIYNFDKEYGAWMEKKDHSMEEEMQIFKKHYLQFEDFYDESDESDENEILDKILDWISDTIGEIYINWGTETQDYYDPGLTLKSIVENFVNP